MSGSDGKVFELIRETYGDDAAECCKQIFKSGLQAGQKYAMDGIALGVSLTESAVIDGHQDLDDFEDDSPDESA